MFFPAFVVLIFELAVFLFFPFVDSSFQVLFNPHSYLLQALISPRPASF